MKRILSFVLVLSLALSTLTGLAFAAGSEQPSDLTVAWNLDDLSTNGNYFIGGDNWRGTAVGADYNSGKALKVTMNPGGNNDGGMWWFEGPIELKVKDWTGATELWFYLDASEWKNACVPIGIGLQDANGNEWKPKQPGFSGVHYYFYDENGTKVTKNLMDWGWMSELPVGYQGWVGISLADYAAAFSSANVDLSKLTKLTLMMDPSVTGNEIGSHKNEYFYIDNISANVEVKDVVAEPELPTMYPSWDLNDLPTDGNYFTGGDNWRATAIGATFDDGKALKVTMNPGGNNDGGMWWLEGTIQLQPKNWTGATTMWFYVDASEWKNSTIPLGIGLVDGNGVALQPGQNGNYGNVHFYYFNNGGKMVTETLNDWGWIGKLPVGYQGWVGVNIQEMATVLSDRAFDFANITGVWVKVEPSVTGNEAGTHKNEFFYIDNICADVEVKDIVVEPELPTMYPSWDLNDLPTNGNYFTGGDNWRATAIGAAFNDGKALKVTMNPGGNNDGGMWWLEGTIQLQPKNWTGATKMWFYVDASEWKNSTIPLGIGLVDGNGVTLQPGQNGNYGNVHFYYFGNDGKMVNETLNDWGWIGKLPVGYQGWVGVNIQEMAAVLSDRTFDFANITGVWVKVEPSVTGNEAGTHKNEYFYIDDFCADVEVKDVVVEPELPTMYPSWDLNDLPTDGNYFTGGDNWRATAIGAAFNDGKALKITMNPGGNNDGGMWWLEGTIQLKPKNWTGATTMWFFVDASAWKDSTIPLGIGLVDGNGVALQPGQNGNYGNVHFYYFGYDGKMVTETLNDWGWIGKLPVGYQGWVGVNIQEMATVLSDRAFDFSNITGVWVKVEPSVTGNEAGTHKNEFFYIDNICADVEIKDVEIKDDSGNNNSPGTGDANTVIWLGMMIASVAILAVLYFAAPMKKYRVR